jgi:replicative DNA helicase
MLDRAAVVKASAVVDESMFLREAHRLLFRAMRQLAERNAPIDPHTLRDELTRAGDFDRVGGMEYILERLNQDSDAAKSTT